MSDYQRESTKMEDWEKLLEEGGTFTEPQRSQGSQEVEIKESIPGMGH